MLQSLALVGNSADFVDAASNDGPAWEHQVFLRDSGVRAVAIDVLRSPPNSYFPARRLVDARKIYRLRKELARTRLVIAQNEQSGYEAALAMVGTATLRGQAVFIIFHGHSWWRRRNRYLAAFVRRMPWVHFLCLSASLRALVIREYGIPASRVHATGYGVDATFFSPERPVGERHIASAGMASRDYKILAEAASGLDTRIRIAADSTWYREALNVRAEDLPGNVEVGSSGNYRALRTLYRDSLFVIVPMLNVRHACGYAVIAEAMAMGKAVIATRTACPSDLVVDGVTGLYVPCGDANALRQAMRRLLANPDIAARMGSEGRKAVEQRFSLDAYVGRIRHVLQTTAPGAA